MAKLIVNPTSPSRREVALSRTLVSIGRDPSNDVVLPDAMVSRRHAVVEYRGSQYYLRDCNSSNGSLVNGDRISERGLRDGDLVAIGTARLLFRDDLVAEDAAGKVIHHPSAPRQQCPSCQQDYRKGDVFCRHCGSSLAPHAAVRTICTACGTAVPMPARFCTACGTRIAAGGDDDQDPVDVPAPAAEPEPAADGPAAEEPVSSAGDAVATEEGDDAAEADVKEDPPPASVVPSAAPPEAMPEPSLPAFHLASTANELAFPELRPPEAHAPASVALAPPELRLPQAAVSLSAVPTRGPALSPVPPRPLPTVAPPAPALMDFPLPGAREREPPPEESMAGTSSGARPAQHVEPATDHGRFMRAGALPRLGAFLVDGLIVTAGQALLALPALFYWLSSRQPAGDPPADVSFMPIFLSVALAALAAILAAVYHVYFWGVKAATPGKRLFGLVVQARDGTQPIGAGRAALRLLGYMVSGLVFGIGFLMIAFGGGGLHDQIAGTRVVRRKGD